MPAVAQRATIFIRGLQRPVSARESPRHRIVRPARRRARPDMAALSCIPIERPLIACAAASSCAKSTPSRRWLAACGSDLSFSYGVS